jgi:hypothetical protein
MAEVYVNTGGSSFDGAYKKSLKKSLVQNSGREYSKRSMEAIPEISENTEGAGLWGAVFTLETANSACSAAFYARISGIWANPLKYTAPDGEIPIPAAVYAVSSYISVVASSPDTQMDIRFLTEDMAQGDYVSAVFDAVGLVIPGLTNTGAISKSAEKIVAKYGDDVGKWASTMLKKAGAEFHHIFTDKNFKKGFTKEFAKVLDGSGLSLKSPEVIVPLLSHKGRHTNAYWNDLLKRAQDAISGIQKETPEYAKSIKTFLNDEAIKLINNPNLLRE